MTDWLLIGGAGFIGQHLVAHILHSRPKDNVAVLDLVGEDSVIDKVAVPSDLKKGRYSHCSADVRDIDQLKRSCTTADVCVNLAAVHREPGHQAHEYFSTNVTGAEHVCRLAEEIGCPEIIFTSSISVYGIHGTTVDERTAPRPQTPYGQSKLKAEEVHLDWARRTGGRLSIIRPGVVFGPGENGNVTRLVKEMLKRQRQIRIEPDQVKAGIYIDELLGVIDWLREKPLAPGESHLVNGVSKENITFNAFGNVLQELQSFQKRPVNVPGRLLGFSLGLLKPFAWTISPASKLHPQRLAKLLKANDVQPGALRDMAYPFTWPLERALADWLARGL